MLRRLPCFWLAIRYFPRLLTDSQQRELFREMRLFVSELPSRLDTGLPQVMESFSGEGWRWPARPSDDAIGELAELAACLELSSGLGFCLRSAVTRYYFLRRAGVPVNLHWGIRFLEGAETKRLGGHAWLSLRGQVLGEHSGNWQNFVAILNFPENKSSHPSQREQ